MDRDSVWASSEVDIKPLGLDEKAGIINLKTFFVPQNASNSEELNIKKAGVDRVGVRKRKSIGS